MMGQPMMMPPGMMPMPGNMGMNAAGQMVPVMMPGMGGGPGQPMFMVRPMGPGQPGMGPMMMQGGMMPGMGPAMMMVPPSAMSNPGQRPHGMMMGPQVGRETQREKQRRARDVLRVGRRCLDACGVEGWQPPTSLLTLQMMMMPGMGMMMPAQHGGPPGGGKADDRDGRGE